MVMFSKLIFFASVFMIFYVYLGYPLLVIILGSLLNRRVIKGRYEPYVTILIAAYNEEDNIAATLQNKIELDYPRDKLEILVISDGSSDKTDEIVRHCEGKGVKLLRQEPRAGKTAALNMAVPQAKGSPVICNRYSYIYFNFWK